jgi:hypothetical protein
VVFFFFFRGQEFELRVLHLLGRRFSDGAMPPALFASVILEIGLAFCPGWPQSSYFKIPTVADMTGVYHLTQLSFIEMGLTNFFAWDTLEL